MRIHVRTHTHMNTIPSSKMCEYLIILSSLFSLVSICCPPLVQEGADPVEPKEKEKPPGQANRSVE